MAPPTFQRKPRAQSPSSPNSKSLRSASPESGSHLKSTVLVVVLTLIGSFLVLRQLDFFTTGEWPESDHIKYLRTDKDREQLQAILNQDANNPLVLAFYSETCLACRRMRTHFSRCAEQIEGIPFYAAHVADENNFNLAKEFDIKTIPAILVLNPKGRTSSPQLYKGKPNVQQLVGFVETATGSERSGR